MIERLIIFWLLTSSLSIFVVDMGLLQGFRDALLFDGHKKLHELVTCHFCTGAWVALVVSLCGFGFLFEGWEMLDPFETPRNIVADMFVGALGALFVGSVWNLINALETSLRN